MRQRKNNRAIFRDTKRRKCETFGVEIGIESDAGAAEALSQRVQRVVPILGVEWPRMNKEIDPGFRQVGTPVHAD